MHPSPLWLAAPPNQASVFARSKWPTRAAKANPELAKKVAHGEVSLPKAAEQVGTL